MTPNFADRICAAVERCATPLIVGIDPRTGQLPDPLRNQVRAGDLQSAAAAWIQFGCGIINVVKDHVSAVKPQVAFFESLGPAGMQALATVIDHAVSANLLVILDGKRNDIGTTAQAYAEAWLGRRPHSAWNCDALTLNPYMGDDSLLPFQQRAIETGSGLFVLVRTSNPGSARFQELGCGDRKLYQQVAAWVENAARQTTGTCGYGAVGAVVGGTHPDQLAELRAAMPHTLFLVPGYGAQGAQAQDLAGAFDRHGRGALINSSRSIIFASRDPRYSAARDWQAAVERAVRDAIEELRGCLPRNNSRPE